MCQTCKAMKELHEMESFSKSGKIYYRNSCRKCRSIISTRWKITHPQKYQEGQAKIMAERSRQRLNLEEQDKFIFWDSRGADRRNGLCNDITRELIRELISDGCRYCGEKNIRMTLDRIDNSKGHTKDNVVPACIRCNYIRRDMPYEAWVIIASKIREAREKGLFGEWTCRATGQR